MAVKKGLLFSCLLVASLALVSCSAGEMLRTGVELARGDDPAEALEARLQRTVDSKKHRYEHDPTRIIDDVKAAKHEFDHVMSLLMRAVGAEWGDDAKAPTRKRYVKYVQNYKSRAMVDYDSGAITVETLMEDDPRRNLKNAIVTTLLTPEDPRAADLFSAREVKLSGTPFPEGLVNDNQGREINNPGRAEDYAEYLVKNQMQRRTISVEGKTRPPGSTASYPATTPAAETSTRPFLRIRRPQSTRSTPCSRRRSIAGSRITCLMKRPAAIWSRCCSIADNS